MGILSRIFGSKDAALRDAEQVYTKLMALSRQAAFYGAGAYPDNYDGRIDVLTLHMAVTLEALRSHGEQGERLAQALFDYMKDDFEIALREEGLSDTGVAKRIKPMIRLFYTRVKDYTEALRDGNSEEVAVKLYEESDKLMSKAFKARLKAYVEGFQSTLEPLSLGQIARAGFEAPSMQPPQ